MRGREARRWPLGGTDADREGADDRAPAHEVLTAETERGEVEAKVPNG